MWSPDAWGRLIIVKSSTICVLGTQGLRGTGGRWRSDDRWQCWCGGAGAREENELLGVTLHFVSVDDESKVV